jgi:hypothetical protein
VNFIPNGSFEDLLPSVSQSAYDGARYWNAIDSGSANSHYAVNMGPPLQNAPYCSFGFQFPKSGRGFILTAFFCTPNCIVWYPKARLKTLLNSGSVYCGRYYVVNTNNNRIAIQEYGMYFGDSSLDTITICNTPLPYIQPQIEHQNGLITDTLTWTPISGTFVATGSEKYVVLGNFNSSASTTTMFINTPLPGMNGNDVYVDDASLVELELSAFAGRDSSILAGDSVFVGREPDSGIDYACQWFQLPNDSIPIDTIAGLWVKPTTKTTYVVRQQLWCSGVKWDTVTIHINTVGLKEISYQTLVQIFPNPAQSQITLRSSISNELLHFEIFDLTGRIVKYGIVAIQDYTSTIVLDQPEGSYIITFKNMKNEKFTTKLLLAR